MFLVNCDKLRRLIVACGCSFKELAEKANLNPATVAKMIDGNKPVQIQTLGKIARALNVEDAFSLTMKI